jgi:hypothetical protein
MAKQRRAVTKAGKPAKYGQCYWTWLGIKKRGKWIKVALAEFFGKGCKKGSRCPNPNKGHVKGDYPLQLLIVHCRPRAHFDLCEDCSCTYIWNGATWMLDPDNSTCQDDQGGNCGGNCQCNPPDGFWTKTALQGAVGRGTKIMTLCIPGP